MHNLHTYRANYISNTRSALFAFHKQYCFLFSNVFFLMGKCSQDGHLQGRPRLPWS